MSIQPFNSPKRPAFIEAAIERRTSGASRLQGFQFFSEYAEPGYSDPESRVICLGNYNNITRYQDGKSVVFCDLPGRIAKILEERYGAELEWSDEWVSCEKCNSLFRCEADSHSWTRYGVIDENGCACGDCIRRDPSVYLESLENESTKAVTITGIDPANHGYTKLDLELESGLCGGQTDDPNTVAKSLKAKGVERFLFTIDSVGQLDVNFSAYVHNDEIEKALAGGPLSTKGDIDPAEAMKRGLEAIAAQQTLPWEKDGIQYNKINPDGTVTSRMVSREEFITGIKS